MSVPQMPTRCTPTSASPAAGAAGAATSICWNDLGASSEMAFMRLDFSCWQPRVAGPQGGRGEQFSAGLSGRGFAAGAGASATSGPNWRPLDSSWQRIVVLGPSLDIEPVVDRSQDVQHLGE